MPKMTIIPSIEYELKSFGMPAQASMVLSRPVLGEARIDHATAATSGGTNSGIMLTGELKHLRGVPVRTTTHENVNPMITASAVPPPQAISELASARWTFGLPRTVMKFVRDRSEERRVGKESR